MFAVVGFIIVIIIIVGAIYFASKRSKGNKKLKLYTSFAGKYALSLKTKLEESGHGYSFAPQLKLVYGEGKAVGYMDVFLKSVKLGCICFCENPGHPQLNGVRNNLILAKNGRLPYAIDLGRSGVLIYTNVYSSFSDKEEQSKMEWYKFCVNFAGNYLIACDITPEPSYWLKQYEKEIEVRNHFNVKVPGYTWNWAEGKPMG